MTVCIAAMCQWDDPPNPPLAHVICITDTMLTAGDVEFEPPQAKVYQFSSNVVALAAGDAADQITICNRTSAALPQGPYSVPQVAAEYSRQFAMYRRESAELKILAPLSLDFKGFLRNQQKLDCDLAAKMHDELIDYELDCETIITGVDTTGSHIFVVADRGHASCMDSIGFAAIGSGGRHAESEFMFAKYQRQWQAPDAMFLAYAAKKRAESTPSVGQNTYMVVINTGGAFLIDEQQTVTQALADRYKKLRTGTQAVERKVYADVQRDIKRLLRSRRAKPQQPDQQSESPQPPKSKRTKKRTRRRK